MEDGQNPSAQLPDHVLELVVERLCLPDLYRFGWVSKPWRSVCDPLQFQKHLPWLIVPINSTNSSMAFDSGKIGFYSLRDEKIYQLDIPELCNRRICGSFPGGWLMTVHDNSEIQLFNPFSTKFRVIHLPPLTKFPQILGTIFKKEDHKEVPGLFYIGTKFDLQGDFCHDSQRVRDTFIHKVAMSSSVVTTGTVVMSIQGKGCYLAFCRIGGDPVWASVTPDMRPIAFHDLTFYKGKFYAVHSIGYVVVINFPGEHEHGSVEKLIPKYPADLGAQYYILESAGDLLVLLRYTDEKQDDEQAWHLPRKTVGFKVLKLEFGTPNKWVEIQSLGDYSIFIGYNTSFSIPASHFSGCNPNCIYFTDNNWRHFYWSGFGAQDFGIFKLQDGCIDRFLHPCGSDTLLVTPPPVWFVPNPVN